jgi:hypothetical protein
VGVLLLIVSLNLYPLANIMDIRNREMIQTYTAVILNG